MRITAPFPSSELGGTLLYLVQIYNDGSAPPDGVVVYNGLAGGKGERYVTTINVFFNLSDGSQIWIPAKMIVNQSSVYARTYSNTSGTGSVTVDHLPLPP
jgi:hypothetical protein